MPFTELHRPGGSRAGSGSCHRLDFLGHWHGAGKKFSTVKGVGLHYFFRHLPSEEMEWMRKEGLGTSVRYWDSRVQGGIDPSTERGGLYWLSGDSEMGGSSTEHEEHPF